MKKKLAMLMASLFLVLGTAWAQTPVLKLTSEQIGTKYPYALSDADAAKVFALTDLTIAVKVNTSNLSGRKALFCTSDPTKEANTDAMGKGSHYVAYGTNDQNISYLASCRSGDRFSSNTNAILKNTENVVLVYVLNPSKNTCRLYINGTQTNLWENAHTDGFMSGYEIATPKMVKEDHPNAKIYIGGGVKANNDSFETFDGTITGIEVYDGVLTAEQIKNVFPFAPEAGKRYALQEATTGLFLDVQTLGIKDGSRSGDNISLNSKPCIVYFEASGDKWKIKNVNGKYISKSSDGDWNPVIGDNSHDWIIAVNENGCVTIARETGKYINADTKVVGSPLYNDKGTAMQFNLIEYNDLNSNYCVLKSPTDDTYLNFTKHASLGTAVTFQSTASELYITPSAAAFYLESKGQANTFVGSTHQWNATTAFSLWTICKQEEGKVFIARNGHTHTNASDGVHLGSNDKTEAGTGIFTNVPESAVENGQTKIYIPWIIEEKIDCPTTATTKDGKLHFKSNNIWFTAPCNTLRFTLTKSGAFFQNGKNRMSLDEFKLYDANGQEVELAAKNVTGNNNKTYGGMFDGVNSVYAGTATWNDGTEDDYFEISLPKGVDLKGAFSFSFVTENTQMDAKEFRIDISYKKLEVDYELNVTTPNNETVTVKYGEQTYENGATITLTEEFNLDLFVATEIQGYVWNVVVDENNRTMTLTYTEVEVEENPEAVVALVNRIGGEGTADNFKFVLDPSINSKQETFVLGAEEGKILIKGTTISAITTGLGWYLNNIAKINIAWNSLNEKTVAVKENGAAYADLSNLPLPSTTETHTSDAKYRYYLNTCTFGYSMTSWTWTRWQQEIDWMALHGINMPLQLVGLEEVWRTFLTMEKDGKRKYGYTDEEAKAFVAGPAFIAWWAMNNLEGWGGTAAGTKSNGTWEGAGGVQDDAWYARQKELAGKIVGAQRALGMQPVIPGWSGMVPTNFAAKSGYATRGNGGNWAGDFVRPLLLNTNVGKDKYAEIAADYYECLHAVMGESQYYSMDPFHEGGGAGTMEDYEALYAAMETANKGSQWVIQQWQWSATQKYSLTAVPAGRLIVLDLFSDGSPAFDGYNGYAPQDAVFCAIPNFGGRSGLMGRLQNVTDNYFKFKGKYASIKGIGTAPEAIEQTPVTYDLIYQLPWMNGEKPNVTNWVNNYAVARYGKDNAVVKEAWSLLRQGPLNYGADGIQGPVEDVWAARPNLTANKASSWGKTLNDAMGTYNKDRQQMLIDAVYKLIDQEDELELVDGSTYKSNYLYDIVEFGGAVMADYAYYLLKGIKEAKDENNTTLYEARRDAFLNLILDMDTFRGTNLNFRLGKWTQEARSAAGEVTGAQTATADWYEYNNARTIVSTWSSPNTNLNDYSYRSWQGLLKDLYYPRWKHYFDNNCPGNTQYGYFEWNWAHGMKHEVGQTAVSNVPLAPGEAGHTDSYTREPEGNTIDEAKKMLAKYIIPVKNAEGKAYYAYRTFTTDLSGKATVTVPPGATVDFTQFFNVPAEATVTGDFLNGVESASIVSVPVRSKVGETYTGTVTLNDGTVLKNFTVKVKVGAIVAGYYHINWKKSETESQPMFIGYNEVTDYAGSIVGYKMLAEGQYATDAAADKVFALVPQGEGFAISAQGKYLKSPAFTGWKHVMFSDKAGEAGVYVFNEVEGLDGVFNIQGQGAFNANKGENPYALHNDYFQIYDINNEGKYIIGNNPKEDNNGKIFASPFTLTPATTYAVAAGKTALCLPFNVKLPEGVVAYDIVEATEETLKTGEGLLTQIAVAGDILKAGTPVILVANEAASLTIVMDGRGAKTSLDGSLLEGNFVKQTVKMGDTKKFILNKEGKFEAITINTEMPANSCWVVTTIEDENAHIAEGYIIIDGWEFTYTDSLNNNRITLKDCVMKGDPDLNIGSTYVVNGVEKTVVAISTDFLHGDTTLTSVEIPATMTNLGFREIVPMFEGSYQGQPGDGGVYDGPNEVSQKGANSSYEFPFDPDTDPQSRYQVDGSFAWRLTLDVAIDTTKKSSFNNYGSAIVSSKKNSLDDWYNGYMQIYMWEDLQHIVVKIDNNDDRYSYSTEALDENGNVLKAADGSDSLLVNTHFKFELEHDGAGGYQVVVTYANGKQKMYTISAGMSTLLPFNTLYYSLPEGIKVDVKFEKLISNGLFVNCTNLKEIKVADGNPTFMACEHGVLYDKNQYYVMRIPEAGGHVVEGDRAHFSIPSKVVKLYPGAVHGVNADIVLHSNPQIGVVKGHEEHVANAKFYLSLDDIDNTIAEGETGYGGARDFVSANTNTYQAARYKRKPLEKTVGDGTPKYGTIVFPFVPENAMKKYEFFVPKSATAERVTFTQVTEEEGLDVNTAYIYRLKEKPENITMENGMDVFETTNKFIVRYHEKYDPTKETVGTFKALGAFVNHYIETENFDSYYYVYRSSHKDDNGKVNYNKFYHITKKLTYRPYRALFVWTPAKGESAPAKFTLHLADGSTTEISPEQVEGLVEPICYDLQGRRVLNPTNGIYIVNGRKVVIK